MSKSRKDWFTLATKGVANTAVFVANLSLAAMLILVCMNVIMRYLFGRPIYWGDEVMIYLMVITVFLGFGNLLMENRHVRMTALFERLKPRTQNIVWIVIGLTGTVYFVFLMVAGIRVTSDSFKTQFRSTITNLPIGPWQVFMCVGLAILLIVSVWFAFRRIRIASGALKEKEREEISHL